jgi:dipeptidyl aminopeptidase/acylaminoacyl peptidase
MTWLTSRRDLPVLLAHGASDDLVSPTFTRTFAEGLEAAGHPVELKLVPEANHQDIYQPAVIADPVIAWITALIAATSSPSRAGRP